jgi:hypothetical protein
MLRVKKLDVMAVVQAGFVAKPVVVTSDCDESFNGNRTSQHSTPLGMASLSVSYALMFIVSLINGIEDAPR